MQVAIAAALCGLALTGPRKHPPSGRRWAASLSLGMLHAGAQFGVVLVAAYCFVHWHPNGWRWAVFLDVATFFALCVLGAAVTATYLHLADKKGWHTLEAFSSMGFEGIAEFPSAHSRFAHGGADSGHRHRQPA